MAGRVLGLHSEYLKKFVNTTALNEDDDSSTSTDEDDDRGNHPLFLIDNDPKSSHLLSVPANKDESNSSRIPHKNFTWGQKSVISKKEQKEVLSSSLQGEIDSTDIYLTVFPDKTPKEASRKIFDLALSSLPQDELLQKSAIHPGFEQQYTVPPYLEGLKKLKRERKQAREKTKGPGWFNLPATELTEERRNDLKILQMRKVLDPKRFYKKNDLKDIPKYYQIGTILDSPADFYHARVPKKERKQTIAEELLADADFKSYNKSKYLEVMAKRQRGRHQGRKGVKQRKKTFEGPRTKKKTKKLNLTVIQ